MSELFSGNCEYTDCDAKWGEAGQVVLVRTIHVNLCTPHQRAFDEFIYENVAPSAAWTKAVVRVQMAIDRKADDIDDIVDEQESTRAVVVAQAIAWVAEHCAS